ncbi:hypothetical protein DFH09DRAFT_935089 [Mycena vulgaris]|nr:hypothetical protein DFH09DRAFT_935089 [Mycena vulgaris]
MERQRSNTHTRLCMHSGPEIFDCTAADLSSIESRRDKFRQMIGYVDSDDGSSRYELFNVPLLHKSYSGKIDVHTVFRGPMLHLVSPLSHGCGCLLRVIYVPGVRSDYPWIPGGYRHEKGRQTSPGNRANTALRPPARWATSADANLSARGAQTGINRHSDLEKYIQYLQSGLDKCKASVLNLFREWCELFFPSRRRVSLAKMPMMVGQSIQ